MGSSSDTATIRPWGTFSLFVERHQVWVFFALVLILNWPYMFLTMDSADSEARLLPLILIGPSASAFLTVYAARGRLGVKELGRRLFLFKAPRSTYLLIFIALPMIFFGTAYAVAGILYPGQVSLPSTNSIITATLNFGIIFLFAGLGEEFGWRGLALPRLQQRSGPLVASLLVGLMWSIWHMPLNIGSASWLTGNLVFLVSLTAASFFYTWIFNRTGGSILVVALLHTMENTLGWPYQDAFSFEPPGFLFFDAVKAGTWVALALLVILVSHKALGYQPHGEPLGVRHGNRASIK